MGVKISAATPAASVAGTELIPVSKAGTPRSVTVDQVKDYTIDQIEAIAAGTTAPLTDKVYILQGGALKPVLLSVVAQAVIDSVWGKAAEASPADTDKIAIKDAGTTENTVTLAVLAEYIREKIEAKILDVSGLDSAGALVDANMFLVTQGTAGKKITFANLCAKIEADVLSAIEGIPYGSTFGTSDYVYILTGGDMKPVPADTASQRALDIMWGKAANESPADAGKLPLVQSGTEATLTLSVLAAYILAKIRGDVLDLSTGIDESTALGSASLMLVSDAGKNKYATVDSIADVVLGIAFDGTAETSPSNTDLLLLETKTGEKVVSLTTLATYIKTAIKDDLMDLSALGSATTLGTEDLFLIRQGGTNKKLLPAVISQSVIDQVWGKADQATPADTNKLPLKDSSTEKTVTLSGLAAYVQTKIRAAVIAASTLGEAGTMADTDLFIVDQGAGGKKVALSTIYDAIYAGLSAHVSALTASSGAADADVFYTVTGAGVRKTTLAQIKTAIGGGVTPPATTTTTRVPQWGASQFALDDGLDVQETVRAQASALHTALATEKAVRDMERTLVDDQSGIAADLADDDTLVVHDDSEDVQVKGAVSRLWTYIWSKFTGATAKETPVDADSIAISDSAESDVIKKTTLTQLWANWGSSKAKAIKLDDFAATDDNTDLDASSSAHGLMPKVDKVKLDAITPASDLERTTTATEATQTVTLRGDCQIAVVDSGGVAIAEPALLRVWISDSDLGAPSDTDNTVAVETGAIIQTVTANAQYMILTSATGTAEIRVTLTGAASRYVMVAWGNRVTSAHLSIAVIA